VHHRFAFDPHVWWYVSRLCHIFPRTCTKSSVRHVAQPISFIASILQTTAPIHDLRECILNGSLGTLNPFPWALQTGNCFGWIAYSWYTADPYMLASNLPGFCFSLWLNIGAAKLQYLESEQNHRLTMDLVHATSGNATKGISLVLVPQETRLFAVIFFWICVLIYVCWIDVDAETEQIVSLLGLINNACLLLYYGAPLQALMKVVRERSSASIHRPTMLLSWVNTSFWIVFGFVRQDWYIIFPNLTGLVLGLAQGVLCVMYPSYHRHNQGRHEHDDSSDEESIAMETTWLVQ